MPPILELKNLNKRFGGIVAVKDFDLRIEKGEIIFPLLLLHPGILRP